MIVPGENTGCDKLTQLLDQHLLTDARNATLQVAEAPRPVLEMIEDQRLPFAADNGKRDVEAAHGLEVCHELYLTLTSR